MIALYVNGEPELISSPSEVSERVDKVLKEDPLADIEKQTPVSCGACGSMYFNEKEAIHCGCHDYY